MSQLPLVVRPETVAELKLVRGWKAGAFGGFFSFLQFDLSVGQ